MKWWIAGVVVATMATPALAGDCQALRDAIMPGLVAVDRADLSLVALGGSFSSKRIPPQKRQEIREAAKRVRAWSQAAIALLEFADVAGCGDAVGARGLRAAAEDLHTDTQRLLARIGK